jgi:hypothetical protein
MYVHWELKKCKDRELATRGKRYRRIGDAWYKMYQLTLKGYEGVHCSFEPDLKEEWTIYGVKFDRYEDMIHLYEQDGKWYFTGERKRVDITDQIEYYDKYRIKKETA